MSIPQVTIGMPIFNGESFVLEALESLLSQSFTDFELIISDNASTDRTEAICQEYAVKDKRIRYVRQAENLGAVANFKFVLDQAQAEYFMWAAADDVWDLKWIAELLPIAMKYQCLAFGRLVSINEEGKRISHPANDRSLKFSGSRMARRMLFFLSPSFHGKANPIYGIIPRMAISPAVMDVLRVETYGADMLFLYNILKKSQIESLVSVCLKKRIHPGCEGGCAAFLTNLTWYTLIGRRLKSTLGMLASPLRNYLSYLSISSPTERILLALLLPIAFFLNVFNLIIWILSRSLSLR